MQSIGRTSGIGQIGSAGIVLFSTTSVATGDGRSGRARSACSLTDRSGRKTLPAPDANSPDAAVTRSVTEPKSLAKMNTSGSNHWNNSRPGERRADDAASIGGSWKSGRFQSRGNPHYRRRNRKSNESAAATAVDASLARRLPAGLESPGRGIGRRPVLGIFLGFHYPWLFLRLTRPESAIEP